MSDRIPNLFGLENNAVRFYSLYLSHLQMRQDYPAVIAACSRIREYAAET
jgi:hypothetical protein